VSDSFAAVVIGAGPAGLAAAVAISQAGCRPVLIVDRDDAAGGLPRFCHHPGFGWSYTHRIETGPAFAARMIEWARSAGAVVMTRTTALRIEPGPVVQIVGPETGHRPITAGAVILATGIRETARGPRLVPGARPETGVLTTGLLQQLVSRNVPVAGRRLVIVGTEHVSFSALLTARHAGMRTVAMVEAGSCIRSYAFLRIFARAVAIPIHTNVQLQEIRGRHCVEAVCLAGPCGSFQVECDAVLFSGEWVPESNLCTSSNIAIDPRTRGPVIDNFFRTSMRGVFAAGNILRSVESSGVAATEGRLAGQCAAAYLTGQMHDWQGNIQVIADDDFEYFLPQRLAPICGKGAPRGLRTASFRVRQTRRNAELVLLGEGRSPQAVRIRHLRGGRSHSIELPQIPDAIDTAAAPIKAFLA
jgi:thioredoxin reductase